MNPFASGMLFFFGWKIGSQFQAKARLEAALRCADGCKVGCFVFFFFGFFRSDAFFSKNLSDLLGKKNILPRKCTNPWSSWASWDVFCCIPLNQLGHLPLKNPVELWTTWRHDLWVGRRADAELRESVEGMTAQVQDFFFSRVLILGSVMSAGNPNIKQTRTPEEACTQEHPLPTYEISLYSTHSLNTYMNHPRFDPFNHTGNGVDSKWIPMDSL